MNLLGVVAVAALALLPLTSRATPITEPIVFDFEDGLQGWELFGSAQRVQTQLLGGEWAIFGDGLLPDFLSLAFIIFPSGALGISLASVDRVTFDVLVLEASGNLSLPVSFPFSVEPESIAVTWALLPESSGVVAFIDNITFHPVPEPSTLVLLGLAIAGLGLRGRTSAAGSAIRAGMERLHRRGRGEE